MGGQRARQQAGVGVARCVQHDGKHTTMMLQRMADALRDQGGPIHFLR